MMHLFRRIFVVSCAAMCAYLLVALTAWSWLKIDIISSNMIIVGIVCTLALLVFLELGRN